MIEDPAVKSPTVSLELNLKLWPLILSLRLITTCIYKQER